MSALSAAANLLVAAWVLRMGVVLTSQQRDDLIESITKTLMSVRAHTENTAREELEMLVRCCREVRLIEAEKVIRAVLEVSGEMSR